MFFIIQYFRDDCEEYEHELAEKNREISQKNSEVHDSITYAKRLQEAIMPPEEEIHKSVTDSFILYKPKISLYLLSFIRFSNKFVGFDFKNSIQKEPLLNDFY